jgi:hypothetical protein
MNPEADGAVRGPTAAEEARTREEVRRRLATTPERARQRHEQTLHRLAGLLHSSKPA